MGRLLFYFSHFKLHPYVHKNKWRVHIVYAFISNYIKLEGTRGCYDSKLLIFLINLILYFILFFALYYISACINITFATICNILQIKRIRSF